MVLWNKLFPKKDEEGKEGELEIELEGVGDDSKKRPNFEELVTPLELFIERQRYLKDKTSSAEIYGKMMEALENLSKTEIELRIIIVPYLLSEKLCSDDIPMSKAAAFTALTLLKAGKYVEVYTFDESNPVEIQESNFSGMAAALLPSTAPPTPESIAKVIKDSSLDTVVVLGYSLALNYVELVRNKKFSKLVLCSFGDIEEPLSEDDDVLVCSGFDKNLCKKIMSFSA